MRRSISTGTGLRAHPVTGAARTSGALAVAVLFPFAALGQSFPEGCWAPDDGGVRLLLAEETATLGAEMAACEKGEDDWTCTLACDGSTLQLVRRNDVTLDLAATGPACGLAPTEVRLHRRIAEACTP